MTQASCILRITCGNIWCQINNKKYWVFTYCIINCTGIVVWIYMYIVSWEFSCTLIYLWWKINCTWIIEQFFYFTWYLHWRTFTHFGVWSYNQNSTYDRQGRQVPIISADRRDGCTLRPEFWQKYLPSIGRVSGQQPTVCLQVYHHTRRSY